MMFYRRNALFSDGPDHDRYRSAITESLARVDPHALRQHTQDSADELIHRVAPTGRAELVRDYAGALPLLTINRLLGANPADGPALVQIMAKLFNGDGDAAAANEDLSQYMARLITAKRARPGPDVTSWLTAHPARLQDTELAQQIALLMAAGTEPLQNLIANTLVLLLSDDRFAGGLAAGTLPVDDALDEVLWALPPLANFGTRYPRTTVTVAGTVLPANQPVLISFEAANRDPRLGEDRSGSRAHLAFSAGSHECPAQRTARGIAAVATERLLDKLPDLALAVPATRLAYTTGPFQYSLTALPVTFPSHPSPPAAPFGGSAWTAPSTASFSTRPEPTSTARPPASGRRARPSRWNCLAAFRRGR
jgi:cytochrome P450